MSPLDYIIILIMGIVSSILGMGWFGSLFGKSWSLSTGLKDTSLMTPEENKEFRQKMMPVYIVSFILNLVLMFSLVLFIKSLSLLKTIEAVLVAWGGFIIPVLAGFSMWSGKTRKDSWTVFLLLAGYYLLTFVISGAIYMLFV